MAFYIYRMKSDGRDAGRIINTPGSQFNRGIAIDFQNKKIYWVNPGDGTIKRANLDGTSQEPVLSGLTDPWDAGLDLVNHKSAGLKETATSLEKINSTRKPPYPQAGVFHAKPRQRPLYIVTLTAIKKRFSWKAAL